MTKTFLKKYWLILTSACCISTGIALCCAGDYGEEYGTSNFTPEIFVDTAYSPFFYSWQFYYGIGHDENHITRFNSSNIKEWSGWLGSSISSTTLDYLLNTAPAASIDSAIRRSTTDKKAKAFLDYLQLAKKCEAFTLTAISPWDIDTTKKSPPFNVNTLNRQLKERLLTSTDPFLQERYWFQLLRSQFFNETPQTVIKTYDDYSSKFPANRLRFRSLAYTAGAYYKLKQYSRANYCYSRVYDSCDELRTVAHYSFHPQEQKDWEGTLALCRNNQEKATLWQMLGIFYSDPQRAIENIYQLDPRSDKLTLLLVRAVNQYEQKFSAFQTSLPGFDMMGAPKDSVGKSFRDLIIHIADAGNTIKPWAWQLAAGYLNMLNKQYSVAAAYYTRAETTVPKERLPRAQLRLLKMLNIVAAAPTIDNRTEQRLLPELEWLDSCQKDHSFRNTDGFAWVRRVMAAKYKLTGEKVKGECLFSQAAFYTSNTNVEALKAFLNKTAKTPWEDFIASLSVIRPDDIFEYQAIQLGMNDKYDEAITAIKQADAESRTILPANPFNARIQDCHDCDQAAAQKIKYSKLSLLEKLKELKDKIAAGQDVYTNAVLLANAQYNITWYGNDRAFYECKIIGSEGLWSIDSVFEAPLTSMQTALKYYTLALNAATNDEQRAKAQYLLAKCQRNEWYNRTTNLRNAWSDGKDNKPDFIAWDGFKALRQYPNTKYYNEVLKECGYFKTYTQKNH